MSIEAMTLVWQRSRAKGANLLSLLAIADHAKDDGRYAWPSPAALAVKSRLTARAEELILCRLVDDGEVAAEWAEAEARLYLHVRCVYAWLTYQQEGPMLVREKISRKIKRTYAQKLCGLTTRYANATAKIGLATLTEPSGTITEPSEGAPAADGISPEAHFAGLWNATTTEPIRPCVQLTAGRRRQIRQRLTERPLTEWAHVFELVQASAFCRGANERGWLADFAWIIGSADVAVKVLEGKYANRSRRAGAPRLAYADWVCPHLPPCTHPSRCQQLQDIAAEKARASA